MSSENQNQISVTQALAELKLLRKRINSGLDDAKFIDLKTKRSLLDVDKFGVQARASLQSYLDLLDRYNRLKSAIVRSNATTEVLIAGKTYTVAEAVERKRSMSYEQNLLETMKQQFRDVQEQLEQHQRADQARIDRLLSAELSKDSKTNVDTIKSLTEAFLAENKVEVIDPLKLEERIKTMEKEMEEFQTKVDWVLSESNGRTSIAPYKSMNF
jgi:hypothetical protein